MGGFGSGNWYRWDKRSTTEEVHSIDIRYMKKHGMLKPGYGGTLSWACGGEQTGWIKYQAHEGYLKLIYRSRSHGEEWRDIEETVWLDSTPCNYGGERNWFLCPHCNRRVAVLYGHGIRFLCRYCYQLPYASQRETPDGRAVRRADKIRERLGWEQGILNPKGWRKPKGMHWRTFERLNKEHDAFVAKSLAGWSVRLNKLRGIAG